MIVISEWFQRTGNNIFQILNGIIYAIEKNHNIVKFPNHFLFNTDKIIIDENKKDGKEIISNIFFYLSILDPTIKTPSMYKYKLLFKKYLSKYLTINILKIDCFDLYVHIRSGDIFKNCIHSLYVQPPLKFYFDIFKYYNNKIIISEDKENPVINKLLEEPRVLYHSKTIIEDIEKLCQANYYIGSSSTFNSFIYIVNPNLKIMYLPKYCLKLVNYIPNEDPDVEIVFVDLPNYIPVGKWKNTELQRNYMLSYGF